MRIALLCANRGRVGGIEAYVERCAAALAGAGHQLNFIYQFEPAAGYAAIALPPEAMRTLAEDGAPEAIVRWRPDLIYTNGPCDPALEAQALNCAPGVFFAHAYSGTCISGGKTLTFPAPTPCRRRFGPACLAYYFPRRCGGLNPLTMWRMYRDNEQRLALLARYGAIVTASDHMREEYLRQGFDGARVRKVGLPAIDPRSEPRAAPISDEARPLSRLLFAGRMEWHKGGAMLLEALPQVARTLQRPISLTLVGEGREQARWRELAGKVCALEPRLRIEFLGWRVPEEIERLFLQADLLVVPSLWPEPFGLIGPEAGNFALPAAAFAVGGITEWLVDGVNGALAPGEHLTPAGLSEAIVRCLGDPRHYAGLRAGATEQARKFTIEAHVAKLIAVFSEIAGEAHA